MKMIPRKAAAFAFLLASSSALRAQRPAEIVKWNTNVIRNSATAATVELSASIQDGWHVYALSQPPGGPTPLKISLPNESHFALLTPVAEGKVTRRDDPGFKMETLYYLNNASFNLSVKKETAATSDTALPIDVRFQACNDRLCLPPYTTHLIANLKNN